MLSVQRRDELAGVEFIVVKDRRTDLIAKNCRTTASDTDRRAVTGKTHPLWMPGEGFVRRQDVVIVKDPTKPPTQDNIKDRVPGSGV